MLFFIFSLDGHAQDSIIPTSIINEELKIKFSYQEKTDHLKAIIKNANSEDAIIGEASKTYKAIQKLLSLSRIKHDENNIIIGLHGLLKYYIWNTNLDKSKTAAYEVLEILKSKEKTAEEYGILGDTYTHLAYIHLLSFNYSEALENILLGNEILTNPQNKIVNKKFIAANYLTLSNVYSAINREKETLDNIKNVIRIYEEDETLTYYGFTGNICIGFYYMDSKKDINKALYHYNKAKEIGEEINDKVMVMDAENHIADAYYKTKQYNKALELFKFYLNLQKKNKDTIDIVYQYYYISKVLKGKNHENESIKYIDSALFLLNSKAIDLPYKKSSLLLSKANIYIEKKNYGKALVSLKENLAFVKTKNLLELKKQIYKNLYGIYNILNDGKNCTFFYDKYSEAEEILQSKSKKAEIKILEANFKYREIKSKLENEKVTLQLSLLKQKRIKIYSYFTLTILLVSTFFIFIIKDRQKKRARAEKLALEVKQELLEIKKGTLDREIEFKDKNITNFALQINENNELLEKIKDPLKQLKKILSGNDTHEKILFEITSLINSYINKNTEKVQLYSSVDENVDNFELKIHAEYCNLTEKEKEIVKKIRLGKASKEIASELNISPASVDNYRYVIRRKMRVAKGGSLEGFIKNL